MSSKAHSLVLIARAARSCQEITPPVTAMLHSMLTACTALFSVTSVLHSFLIFNIYLQSPSRKVADLKLCNACFLFSGWNRTSVH